MPRIAIIVGHARKDTFCEALGETYRRGAEAGGYQATLFVTSRMTFDPVLHEGFTRLQPLEPDLQAAHDTIIAADHIVFIFPLWLGTLPAIFKGKSARVIMTMGMPGLIYRWYFGAFALRMLKRNILGFVGVSPTRSTIHGMIEAVTPETRQSWLADAEAMGRWGETASNANSLDYIMPMPIMSSSAFFFCPLSSAL